MCWFDKVKQTELNGVYESSVSLGKWDSWVPSSNHKSMQFTMGQMCWNGPSRSTVVQLECGPVTEIFEVEEPSTCQYVMRVRTPAACQAPVAPEPVDDSDKDL